MRCNECPIPSLIPESWPGVIAYGAVKTQWRVSAGMGGGGRTGLDYAAVLPVLRAKLQQWREEAMGLGEGMTEMDLLEDVQVMEMAILEVQAEQRADAQAAG